MDKVELDVEDIAKILEWRDSHLDLVKALPVPLKAVDIVCSNGLKLRCIRKEDYLTIYVEIKGIARLGKAKFRIDKEKRMMIGQGGTLILPKDEMQSILTVYCALMALMSCGGADLSPDSKVQSVEEKPPQESKPKNKKGKPKKKQKQQYKGNGVTYILRKTKTGRLTTSRKGGHHSKPNGIFTVHGHFRHYKSGKTVWIAPYKKGEGKERDKTYRLEPKPKSK